MLEINNFDFFLTIKHEARIYFNQKLHEIANFILSF